jgi:hypothetical protein
MEYCNYYVDAAAQLKSGARRPRRGGGKEGKELYGDSVREVQRNYGPLGPGSFLSLSPTTLNP